MRQKKLAPKIKTKTTNLELICKNVHLGWAFLIYNILQKHPDVFSRGIGELWYEEYSAEAHATSNQKLVGDLGNAISAPKRN